MVVFFIRQGSWFFLNSEQNSVLECHLLKLDCLQHTVMKRFVCLLHVCLWVCRCIHTYIGSEQEAEGSFEQETGLDNLLGSLPA